MGRDGEAEVSLPHDLLASPRHCVLELNERGCIIEDLGSRQGTLVNGVPVGRSLLNSGDSIKVGLTELAVTIEQPGDLPSTVLRRSKSPDSTILGESGGDRKNPALMPAGFSLVRQLGAGAMGVVYEARRDSTGEQVAIKTIVPAPGISNKAIPLFLREAEILARLEHKHIVRFIEFGEAGGQVYLVTEYVPLCDLEQVVGALPGPRQTQVYCGLICQVLEALEYAHHQGLVHRDVKPRNILVSHTAGRLRAKLADFGLAKNYHTAGLSKLTHEGEVRGTPAFMPPEQARDSRSARPTVDVYATGATLYWYLTGHSPLKRAPRDLHDLRSLLSEIVPLHERRPDLPEGVLDAVERALAPEARSRFTTAAEFASVLGPYGGRS